MTRLLILLTVNSQWVSPVHPMVVHHLHAASVPFECFVLFPILTCINSVNDNIQFTSEQMVDSFVFFLDVMIAREADGSPSTNVCTKPIHMNQYLHFSSHHLKAHKSSVTSSLLKKV